MIGAMDERKGDAKYVCVGIDREGGCQLQY